MNLGTPKAGAKCELLFNKLASGTAVGNGKEKMAKKYFFSFKIEKVQVFIKIDLFT
jgi:hypothetical protein